MPPLATVDMTVAISTGVAMIVPRVRVSTGSRWMPGVDGRLGLMPILPAIVTTLLMPTASSIRANAQFTESAVAWRIDIVPPSPSPALEVSPRPLNAQGEFPETESFGENPFESAVASVMTFHVDPICRPYGWVAMLYWLVAKLVPGTMAFTAPVFGSMATSDDVNPESRTPPMTELTAFWAFCCAP